ncbi:MAG TPA: Wadjet anti-phage system protein JetD domain-containing protein [Segeticoccus sp.]|nr:Wadjet anti-phage system protein JetD domain-containing protein [Segeticoccus sp.]
MTRGSPPAWTTPDDIAARVRRRWDDGSLLGARARGEPFPEIDLPLRGPTAREVAADLGAVQSWARQVTRGSRGGTAYTLVTRQVGGRVVGRNTLPARAQLGSYQQAWRLLGVADEVATFERLRALTAEELPSLGGWVSDNPLRVLAHAGEWPRVLATARWLCRHSGRGRYLREVEAPGVDSKFIEVHRALLADLLEALLPSGRVDTRHSRGSGFAERFGFASPPRLVRMRVDEGFAGLPPELSEVAVLPQELARLRVGVQRAVVVENLVTYLAVPVPPEGVVIWGGGYAAGRMGRIPWLRDADVVYAGDLDTHGFAILSLLRGLLPQTRSVLMDRATLMAHRDRWGQESSPTRARLEHLTGAEQSLYQDLVEDVFAPSLRLEQERLDWAWVEDAFAAMEE